MAESGEVITIRVRQMDGLEIALQVAPSERVSRVKALIQQLHPQHIEPERQRLIFAGRVLNDHQTLQDYRVQHDKVVHLVVRPAVLPSAPQLPPQQQATPAMATAAAAQIPVVTQAMFAESQPAPGISVMSFTADNDAQIGNFMTTVMNSIASSLGAALNQSQQAQLQAQLAQQQAQQAQQHAQQAQQAQSVQQQAQSVQQQAQPQQPATALAVLDDVPEVDVELPQQGQEGTANVTDSTASIPRAQLVFSPPPTAATAPPLAPNHHNHSHNHHSHTHNHQHSHQHQHQHNHRQQPQPQAPQQQQQQQQQRPPHDRDLARSLEHAMINLARLNSSLGPHAGGLIRHDAVLDARDDPLLGVSNCMWALHRAMHAIELPVLQLANGTRDLYDNRLDPGSRQQILTPEQLTETSSMLNQLSAACSALSNSLLLLRSSPAIAAVPPEPQPVQAPPTQQQTFQREQQQRAQQQQALLRQAQQWRLQRQAQQQQQQPQVVRSVPVGGHGQGRQVVIQGPGRGPTRIHIGEGPVPPNAQPLSSLPPQLQQSVLQALSQARGTQRQQQQQPQQQPEEHVAAAQAPTQPQVSGQEHVQEQEQRNPEQHPISPSQQQVAAAVAPETPPEPQNTSNADTAGGGDP